MSEHGGELLVASVVFTAFAIGVTLLLYYWPFPCKPFFDATRKQVRIVDIVEVSHDVKRFRCSTGDRNSTTVLGLPIGKNIRCFAPNPASCINSGKWNGDVDLDKGAQEITRTYTPVGFDEKCGYFELFVKIYRPGSIMMPDGKGAEWLDGGKMGMFMDTRKVGDYLDVQGPVGVNEYLGRSLFKLPGKTFEAKRVVMLAGGTGITPMLQLVTAALRDKKDSTQFWLLYANRTEDDILARDLLEDAAARDSARFKCHFTVERAQKDWKHRTGFIDAGMIKQCMPAASKKPLVLMCGPPAMIEQACKPSLEALGYDKSLWVTL